MTTQTGTLIGIARREAARARLDEQHSGLTSALTPDWRGGVACRILRPGRVRLDDAVRLTRT